MTLFSYCTVGVPDDLVTARGLVMWILIRKVIKVKYFILSLINQLKKVGLIK